MAAHPDIDKKRIPLHHQPTVVTELYERLPATHQKNNCAKLPAKTTLVYFCSSTNYSLGIESLL